MKRLSNKNVELLLEPSLRLFMLFFILLISRKNCWEFLGKKTVIWWRYIDDIFFIWKHSEESLRDSIDQVNLFHPTIKCSAEYSKEVVNFLDLNIKLIDGELKTDLSVKPTDTHQFLDPTSSHLYHCKKGISYSQALRLKKICSDNTNFDKRCNDLEKWLMGKGYNEKMVRSQILRVCEHSRNDLLEREKQQMSEQKLTFNSDYYPAFQNVRAIMEELRILLTPKKEHKKVFPNVPVIGFRNGESMKDFLFRATLSKINSRCKPCGKKSCLLCVSISTATTLTTKACQETLKFRVVP